MLRTDIIILQELVQNAEDAGATVVEVLHDARDLECVRAHNIIQRFVRVSCTSRRGAVSVCWTCVNKSDIWVIYLMELHLQCVTLCGTHLFL